MKRTEYVRPLPPPSLWPHVAEYREQNDRHAASLARESTRLRIARLDRDNRKAEDRTREKPGGS